MANLEPTVLPLDKGLNLQTAKIITPAGSVLNTLNYEQVDFQGQKRIDGFARYDGSTAPILDDYHKITVASAFGGSVGSLVSTDAGLLGVAVGVSSTVVYVAVIDNTIIPDTSETLYYIVDGANTGGKVITAITTGVASGITADQHYTNLLAFDAVLRAKIEGLPGNIIGLHWFRDRLYAVADVTTVSLLGVEPAIHPNDTLVLDGVNEDVKVLDILTLDSTRVLFLSTLAPDAWQVEGTEVFRNSISMGFVANGFETLTASQEVASFFESRTEAQVLEEDGPSGPYNFGWRFVDQGWLVMFENGTSAFGSLPSLNQNITGLGIQGPTSVAANNGRPLALDQKVGISNKPTQVNGWKSSQSTTTFELEPDNLIDTDSDYIYADAYISWDGTTGEVVAITDPLVEYPASNTVVIEL